ncbi:hypothetical protein Ga0080559_TMP3551 [Salipiger profundus]|uniref:Uncharacterized protein n=1 Tax=Salipiger profundus TaxID=1229727 RepID=A0A1U7D844_9RHOB|nr:hypothetical protein Ga0080559_TMP3551 [Salipiger profundus]
MAPATSKPVTAWPALARLAAMGAPMLPSPMNAIFMSSPPRTKCRATKA